MSAYHEEAVEPGTGVSVPTATSTLVVDENPGRLELVITNDSDTTIYLRLADPAAVSSGLRLNANGGSWASAHYRGPVYAFHSGGTNKAVLVVEV